MVQKQLRTFHCFAKLPKELRDCIWELAIQNDKDEPEIHFFSASEDLETYQVDSDLNPDPNDDRWLETTQCLRAPTWKSHTGLEGWASHRNPSGYLLDAGLWFACAESRDCMIRNRKAELYHGVVGIKLPTKKGSWQRHIATQFEHDLFVFQLPISRILSLPLGILEELTSSHHFWSWLPFCGIEYDPQWIMRFDEGDEEGRSKVDMDKWETDPFSRLLWEIAHVSTTMCATRELWLVDHHTLKPAAGMTCAELGKDRITFKARGWRYFEVLLDDIGDRWEVAKGFTKWQTPWNFAWAVAGHPNYIETLDRANVKRDSASKFQKMFWNVAACIKDNS